MYEDVAQSLFNLNYAICSQLSKNGYPISYDAIMRGAPDFEQCTTAVLTTILGQFQVAYVR
jgi:hypothetical protein